MKESGIFTIDGGRMTHAIQLGTYKRSDDYSRKHGWPPMSDEAIGGSAILLYGNEHRIDYFDTIAKGVSGLLGLLEKILIGLYC